MYKSAGRNSLTGLIRLIKEALADNSVSASVSKDGAVATITVTDKNGTTTTTIADGTDASCVVRSAVVMDAEGTEVAVPSSVTSAALYTDTLTVYWNGMLLTPDEHYVLDSTTNVITLQFTAAAGDTIEFLADTFLADEVAELTEATY